MNCKNCGDLIGNERDSDDKFCTDQCKVEYELDTIENENISLSLNIQLLRLFPHKISLDFIFHA